VAPPNQNLQIFTNPLLNHKITFVKARETTSNYVMNVDVNNDNNKNDPMEIMIGVIDAIPCKG
jgi:hypothetical protein